jgi:uncharacterized membrane protein YGL010W
VEYHRDPSNCAMHVVGIIFLFLAAVLPLSLWPVTIFGVQSNVAAFMVVPVLIYWVLLDAALGLALVGAGILLLIAAAIISSHVSVTAVWIISIVLIVIGIGVQIIGHKVFEGRKPALLDNPPHLLLGPMFVMAKLFIALGFRNDLAVVIQPGSQPAAGHPSIYPHQRQGDVQQDP